jgi:hypothetical protein
MNKKLAAVIAVVAMALVVLGLALVPQANTTKDINPSSFIGKDILETTQ